MLSIKPEVSWLVFSELDIRVGTVLRADPFPEARNPAIQLWLDFGSQLGTLKTSAQITDYYDPDSLIGKQLVAVVNFPPKQIGSFMSECLVLGVVEEGGEVVLLSLDAPVRDGLQIA